MFPCSTTTPTSTSLYIYLYIHNTLHPDPGPTLSYAEDKGRSVSRSFTAPNVPTAFLGRSRSNTNHNDNVEDKDKDSMPGLSLSLPPFPDDIPTIPLLVIDYELIKAGDQREIERLWDAATDLGFW